jgi:hypothetical protein
VLLIVAPSATTARWCAAPIDLGRPGFVLRPLVLGPDTVAIVTDPEEASLTPELALLSVIAHCRGDHGREIALAVIAAAASLDDDRARLYADLALASVPGAIRKALEEMMDSGKYQYQSAYARKYVAQGKAEGRAEGKAEGRAQGVLTVLEARSLEVSDQARARILSCSDLGTLDAWLRRAVTVGSTAELFHDADHPGR